MCIILSCKNVHILLTIPLLCRVLMGGKFSWICFFCETRVTKEFFHFSKLIFVVIGRERFSQNILDRELITNNQHVFVLLFRIYIYFSIWTEGNLIFTQQSSSYIFVDVGQAYWSFSFHKSIMF